MKSVLTAIACLALAACVSVTPAGERVRVTTNPEAVRGCASVGNVRSLKGRASGLPVQNVEKDLRNQTAALGGNTLFVISLDPTGLGEAYRCP